MSGFYNKMKPLLPVLRGLQFLFSLVGLILSAIYLSRLFDTVFGIYIAGIVFAIIAVGQYAWNHRQESSNKPKRLAMAVAITMAFLDVCFVILFAIAARLIGPSSIAARVNVVCYGAYDVNDNGAVFSTLNSSACGKVKGVFALSILNALAHFGSGILNVLQSVQGSPKPKEVAEKALVDEE